jgi:Ca-activated chloride channel family protein
MIDDVGALIIITDGEDRNSFYKQEQLFSRLREEDVQIFVLASSANSTTKLDLFERASRDKAVNLINRLASETGGRAFFPQS